MSSFKYDSTMERDEPITCIIRGGLGNQMFKAAAGIHIANLSSRRLDLDIGWFEYQDRKSGLDTRSFELDYFPNTLSIPRHQSGRFKSFLNGRFEQYRRSFSFAERTVTEKNYDSHFKSNFDKARYINDSFEDIKFLPPGNLTRRIFSFPTEKSSWLQSEMLNITKETNVAIHVRMGDYLNFSTLYDVLDRSYYLTSIEILKEKLGEFRVTLFSDDPEKAILFLGPEIQIDRIQAKASAPETLELLSNFTGIVAANSTFSWWAGYLGNLNGSCQITTLPNHFLKNYPISERLHFFNAVLIPSNSTLPKIEIT
jgi:Glycosyl transferase family 11